MFLEHVLCARTHSSVIKHLPDSAGDVNSIPGLGRFYGEGNGNPLQWVLA